MKYVALLRGINVGKSTQVPMKTLSARFAELGLSNVVAYLNSGNVVFESALGVAELTQRIEDELEGVVGEWLGVPMFFSSFDAETLIRMIKAAGFDLLESAIETQREGSIDIPYLWVLAQRL